VKRLILLFVFLSLSFQSAFGNVEDISEFDFGLKNQDSYVPKEPIYKAPYRSAALAAGLSALLPGLGHAYIGDMETTGCFFVGTGLAFGASTLKRDPTLYIPAGYLLNNTWMYGVYAAYRDTRILNGSSYYSYKKMPTDSLFDLATAPFRPSILKKPEVWGGLICKLAVAFGVGYLRHISMSHSGSFSHSTQVNKVMPFMAFPVGMGEEAFFRGYLQPQLSETFNSPAAGLVLSSLLFGGAHFMNTLDMDRESTQAYCTYSIPLITASGFYYGWLANKNCSLQEVVAIHALYDFTLFSLAAALRPESILEEHHFSVSIPF